MGGQHEDVDGAFGGGRSVAMRDCARRGPAEQMSEATLDRSIGSAESLRPADRLPAPQPRHPRTVDVEAAIRSLPRGDLSPFQRWFRSWFSRTVSALIIKTWFRVEVVGAEHIQDGPAVYCFNHLSWLDPLLLLAYLPKEPRIFFYGPKEEDLRSGGRNRFMWWTDVPIPFSPLKDDLLTSVKWVQAVFDSGGVLAISGEGTIHLHEGDLLPFEDGPAYFALRGRSPARARGDHRHLVGRAGVAGSSSGSANRSRRGSARPATRSPTIGPWSGTRSGRWSMATAT